MWRSLIPQLLTSFLLIIRGPDAAAQMPLNDLTNVVYRLYKGAVVGAVTNVEAGAFGFDSENGVMRYYDGSNWRSLLQTDGSALQLSGIEIVSVTAGVNTVTVELPILAEYSAVPGGVGSNVNLSMSVESMTGFVNVALQALFYKDSDLSGSYADPTVVGLRGYDLQDPAHAADYSPLVFRTGTSSYRHVNPITFFSLYETDHIWGAVSNQVQTDLSSQDGRITALETAPAPTATIAWSNLYPMAGVSMGLDLLYSDENTVQFTPGSIFGPTGSVYRRTNVLNYDVTPPGASGFVYLFVDASASTPGAADGLAVTQSSTAPARNTTTRQWVSTDDTNDRYLGCVLWITDSPAGMAKFQYSQGAYELCDSRLFPATATGISDTSPTWHAKVILGTQQTMTGAWVAPETDAADILPATACAALVGAVWSFYNSGSTPGAIGYAVVSSEAAADSYGTDTFLTADRVDAVWDLAPGGFAGRGGGPSSGSHLHSYLVGANQTGSAAPDLRSTVARTGWVQLGASRNLRIAADAFDLGAPVADWAILGWKESR